jgi:tight adherence protein C
MFDFSYILIFAASAALVFGVGALFEKPHLTTAAISIRRGSTGWFATHVASKLSPSDKDRLTNGKWLLQAGFESPDASQVYTATRMLLATVLPLITLIVLPIVAPSASSRATLLLSIFAVVIGFVAPRFFVQSRRATRQQAVRNGLPDILDLLLVSTEAGLGLDTAILRVGEESVPVHPVLAHHLLQISSELRAGRPRAECFRALGDRCGIQETTTLVNLLVQSDVLGTSMATTLRAYAEDLRAHRLLRAEEIGQKMGVKLSMVLITCFLPALFMAIFTPVIIKAIHQLGQYHH